MGVGGGTRPAQDAEVGAKVFDAKRSLSVIHVHFLLCTVLGYRRYPIYRNLSMV